MPAFFSEIRAGDFYLVDTIHVQPGSALYAASDCIRFVPRGRYGQEDGWPTFMIKNGSEIRQLPMRDINPVDEPHVLEHNNLPRLENK